MRLRIEIELDTDALASIRASEERLTGLEVTDYVRRLIEVGDKWNCVSIQKVEII